VICKDHPSPNFGPRRGVKGPDMVVLHYTAMQTAADALERLCNPDFEVSAHYLISETGEVFQLVSEDMRAWHAGAGRWGNVDDVNSHSIGIELANCGFSPFSEPQMAALILLLKDIKQRWGILPKRIIGHSDMAPGRKLDPGRRFDWQRLAICGVSIWPDSTAKLSYSPRIADLLQTFGMTTNCSEETLLSAFRLRFRPWKTGPVDNIDLAMATDLCNRFAVDLPALST